VSRRTAISRSPGRSRSLGPGLAAQAARFVVGAAILAGPGASLALAQATPSPTEAAPTLQEALDFVNSHLSEHASPWRPCRATAKLVLIEGGDITVEVTRSSYCENSQQVASIHALDPSRVTYEVANEILVRIPCAEDQACARYMQQRKKRDGESWALRDAQWIPKPPVGQEHMIAALELPMGSRADKAADVASALAYLVKAAKKDPSYADPPDRFDREPPAAASGGGT
jgi:hypothetical protein